MRASLADSFGMLQFDSGVVQDPYGYVYRVEYRTRDGLHVYVGQHKYQRGQAWDAYKGSGTAVQHCVKDSLTKRLVALAQSQAELDLREMVEIARARTDSSTAHVRLVNIEDGGRHRFHRAQVDFKLFERRVSDEKFVELVEEWDWSGAVAAVASIGEHA